MVVTRQGILSSPSGKHCRDDGRSVPDRQELDAFCIREAAAR